MSAKPVQFVRSVMRECEDEFEHLALTDNAEYGRTHKADMATMAQKCRQALDLLDPASAKLDSSIYVKMGAVLAQTGATGETRDAIARVFRASLSDRGIRPADAERELRGMLDAFRVCRMAKTDRETIVTSTITRKEK